MKNSMQSIIYLIFVFLTFSPFDLFAAKMAPISYVIPTEKGESHIEFLAIGRPSALRIRGKGENLQGTLNLKENKVSGKLIFPLESLDTGIHMRNAHMKEKYLEITKYPNAQFSFVHIALPPEFFQTTTHSLSGVLFDGMMDLHGVQKSVQGKLDVDKNGSDVHGLASMDLKLSDFNIQTPSFKGITMAQDVHVEISFKLPVIQK